MKKLNFKKLKGREAEIGILTILGFIGLLILGIAAGVAISLITR